MIEQPRPFPLAGVATLLPGLVHFGARAIRLYPETPIRWLRLSLPGRGALSLARVTLHGLSKEAVAAGRVRTVARDGSTAPTFRNGGAVQTAEIVEPEWLIEWDEPVPVTEIELRNRGDRLAAANYALRCEWEDANGALWQFSNLDPRLLELRLGGILADQRQLLDALRALPKPERQPFAVDLAAFAEASRRFAAVARAALDGGGDGGEEARALRLATMRSLAAILKMPRGATLARLLPLAAPLLSALLDRAGRGLAQPDPAELDALAIILAADFIADGAPRATINENDALLRSRVGVMAVETEIDRLYVAATGDTTLSPIMFRSHGLAGSDLLSDAQGYVTAMKEVEALLAGVGVEAAICYGTLLGAVRTGSFIPHDDDVDMIMHLPLAAEGDLPGRLKEVADALEAAGARVAIKRQLFLKVWPPASPKEVDLFPVIDLGDRARMHMESLTIRDTARDAVLPFSRMSFYGTDFAVPADPPAFLADRYGPTWQTPTRQAAVKTTAA